MSSDERPAGCQEIRVRVHKIPCVKSTRGRSWMFHIKRVGGAITVQNVPQRTQQKIATQCALFFFSIWLSFSLSLSIFFFSLYFEFIHQASIADDKINEREKDPNERRISSSSSSYLSFSINSQ